MIEIQFPYEFPFSTEDLEKNEYKVFSAEFEDNENMVFHGTNYSFFENIKEEGVKINGGLPSISFASNSGLALSYACDKRNDDSCGVVLAVNISSYRVVNEGDKSYVIKDGEHPITKNGNVYHLCKHADKLDIIAYCLIPKEYQHT